MTTAAAAAADVLSGLGLLPGSGSVYLVDMASYRPPDELRMVMPELRNVGRQWKLYMPETERLATKVLEKSGLSPNATYLPPAVHPCHTMEPLPCHGEAHCEAEMVMIGAVRELLDKTGTKPEDIDILITCASIWCATPSQAAMVINHFGLREDVQAYHFGGMGCATGVLLMALVKDILRARPNSRLLFVASETTTFAFYPGMEVSRRVSNVIFRMGGTAVLFSNKRSDALRAKYRLQHHVRFHTSADDKAYRCISWSPDDEGHVGVYLGKDVVDQAGAALTMALSAISPKIMTWTQLGEAACNLVQKRWLGVQGLKRYQPDFSKCVDYFLIHAGGYAVLKGIQAGMRLPASAMLPSFAALRDYGNTSASTTWYSFSYLESCVGVKPGQKIMQIGCGGGMKVAIAIWHCLRDVRENHKAWRHLSGPLTEADLPRSISESAKLAAALKAGAGHEKPPVATAATAAAAAKAAVRQHLFMPPAAAAAAVHVEPNQPAAAPAAAAPAPAAAAAPTANTADVGTQTEGVSELPAAAAGHNQQVGPGADKPAGTKAVQLDRVVTNPATAVNVHKVAAMLLMPQAASDDNDSGYMITHSRSNSNSSSSSVPISISECDSSVLPAGATTSDTGGSSSADSTCSSVDVSTDEALSGPEPDLPPVSGVVVVRKLSKLTGGDVASAEAYAIATASATAPGSAVTGDSWHHKVSKYEGDPEEYEFHL